ncbi:SET domain-containing protein 4 isoform X2 [Selaginella moellendorffii]|uniref:SET domain-containing protein 4 isoform X2 n=1 Tax=Selaginella moellendorffii TaxID=88036 RepID=UPI000D1C3EF5|nr:SET domain-containing protein 4 isoform X2 [Selaginella moellendorffii]|eukprot:XP_024524044.1 SET domain-containing protein 4 isoform X2 [Selaginella moellendorffii]
MNRSSSKRRTANAPLKSGSMPITSALSTGTDDAEIAKTSASHSASTSPSSPSGNVRESSQFFLEISAMTFLLGFFVLVATGAFFLRGDFVEQSTLPELCELAAVAASRTNPNPLPHCPHHSLATARIISPKPYGGMRASSRRITGARSFTASFSPGDRQCPEWKDFLAWLNKRGGLGKNTAVTIGMSQYGRALFATRRVPAGSRFLEIPRIAIITPENVPSQVSHLLSTSNPKTRLSLFLLSEKHKAQESQWAPYLRCLPQLGDIESTDEELAWLKHSPTYRETMECLKIIKSEFHVLEANVFPWCRDVLGEVSLTDFMHAYSTVSSRSWESREGDLTMSMIPFADFFNHDHNCQTRLSYDKEKDCAVAVADQDYKAGDEIFLSYGSTPNSILAVDYGFAVASNPHEQVEVPMGVSLTDPLRDLKLQTLSRHNMSTDLNDDGSPSGRKRFTFRDSDLAERGSMAVAPLRAFARLICAESYEDLEEMAEESITHDVFYALSPRRDERKESEAVSFVCTQIKQQVDQHSKALKDLDDDREIPLSRKSILRNILTGELRVLRNLSCITCL